jgi:2-hydroxychromene-2-carboxylate isomerase
MNKIIEYFNINSPWSFMGHHRLLRLQEQFSFNLELRPVAIPQIFQATGGTPLPQRHPSRQQYRFVELKRWADRLELPLNLKPAHFPSSDLRAHASIMDLPEELQLKAAEQIGFALWCEEADIADPNVISDILKTLSNDAAAAVEAQMEQAKIAIEENGTKAIEDGVFGMPSYLVDDELFWGQDRLDFVMEKLAR